MTNQTEVAWKDSWCQWLGCSLRNPYEQKNEETCNYKCPRLENPLGLVTFWQVIRSSLLQPNLSLFQKDLWHEKSVVMPTF